LEDWLWERKEKGRSACKEEVFQDFKRQQEDIETFRNIAVAANPK
jgi:hypothetical protein